MESAEHNFQDAVDIDAVAIGEPGQRRFRLMVRSADQTAAIWMEKQQLASIGEWLQELVARRDREQPAGTARAEPQPFGEVFDLDLRASQIGLGYNELMDTVELQFLDMQTRGAATSFQCRINRAQSRTLGAKIAEVVAAGRPLCPLCAQPIDPAGHVCPRSNGHHLTPV